MSRCCLFSVVGGKVVVLRGLARNEEGLGYGSEFSNVVRQPCCTGPTKVAKQQSHPTQPPFTPRHSYQSVVNDKASNKGVGPPNFGIWLSSQSRILHQLESEESTIIAIHLLLIATKELLNNLRH